ncbi:MAG: tetratricopeptide repeat protein, partial [Bdellovibrio sp.]|nr:tetratricopeptide repeat protein [Bdellovibrio sp.]
GEILFKAGEFNLAKNIYRTLFQSGERPGLSLYWMGRCNEQEGRIEDAEKNYEESIVYQPSLEAFQRHAALLIRKQKDHQAAEVMERALTLTDISTDVLFEIHKATGNCWLRSKNEKKAEHHYRKALELKPASDAIHTSLGNLYLAQGRVDEAKRSFQGALSLNVKNDRALAQLATLALSQGDARGAHDLLAESLEINLQNPQAIYHLVKCAYEIKSYATAARLVQEYVQSAPINTNLLYSLAGLQFHLGRLRDAKLTVQKILAMDSNHLGALDLRKLIDQYSERERV